MTKLEELRVAYDAATEAAVAACDAAYAAAGAAYADADATYDAAKVAAWATYQEELKKIQEENPDD
jgi:hypothetical protein